MRNVSLPLLRSDKGTFNNPDDREYPVVQVNITVYHYPDVFGKMYLGENYSHCMYHRCVGVGNRDMGPYHSLKGAHMLT